MKTLTLTIAEPWFSMIRDGKKKEEYREIKDHYFHMLYNYAEMQKFFGVPPQPYHFDRPQVFHTKQFQKHFDLLVLRNGYRADSPKITLKNPSSPRNRKNPSSLRNRRRNTPRRTTSRRRSSLSRNSARATDRRNCSWLNRASSRRSASSRNTKRKEVHDALWR